MSNESIAIGQFDGAVSLLKIELATGNFQIVPIDEVDESQISFGMFEIETDNSTADFVALLATPDGPLLLFKDFQYRPEIDKTRIEISDGEEFSCFRISHEEQVIFSLLYKNKFGIGLHPYVIGLYTSHPASSRSALMVSADTRTS
jgi:hypothetical protein